MPMCGAMAEMLICSEAVDQNKNVHHVAVIYFSSTKVSLTVKAHLFQEQCSNKGLRLKRSMLSGGVLKLVETGSRTEDFVI